MANKEFPFADIKYRERTGQSKRFPQVPFLSPFFIDLSVEKKAHIMGLIFSAIYFKSMHSDRYVRPVKLITVSQLNPFCIHRCICLLYISITQHSKCLYKEKVTLPRACPKSGQDQV